MPPKGKRNAANQHDKRHENGLAAPGKRIQKQRSNPNLNGHANGKAQPPTPPLPSSNNVTHDSAAPAMTSTQSQPRTADSKMAGPYRSGNNGGGAVAVGGSADIRQRAISGDSLEVVDAGHEYASRNSTALTTTTPPSGACLGGPSKTSSLFKSASLALTILSSCPLRDAIAMLIILLQLPSTVLTIVHFLFASLAFVPSSSSSSLSALPSLTDMFQGSGGSPSLALILFIDFFILIVWLWVWTPVQSFVVDMAQAVIAISLGGAAGGRGGTTNSLFICGAIILASNSDLGSHAQQFMLYYFGPYLGKIDSRSVPSSSSPTYRMSYSRSSGWIRNILGIHILAQGVLRMIRRSLSRRASAQVLPSNRRVDPDAGASSQNQRGGQTNAENAADLSGSPSTDGRPPGPPATAKESRDKSMSSRRKKKHAAHVRGQQPFWAAVASTKVHVLTEWEQNQAGIDAFEANARDVYQVGSANFKTDEDRVWIELVKPTQVEFGVSLYVEEDADSKGSDEQRDVNDASGEGRTKPFYVRVNGADWSSTRAKEAGSETSSNAGFLEFWQGEIFGLTATSSYNFEFVKVGSNEVLCSLSVITPAEPNAEQTSVVNPASRRTLRPSSPITTLKNSVAAADQRVQDSRNKLKQQRKNHKTGLTAVKKEVEGFRSRLSNSGNSDERQRAKVLQMESNIRQAEEAAIATAREIEELGEIPEEEHDEAAEKERCWRKEMSDQAAAREEIQRSKTAADRELNQIQSEISTALQKRERLQTRIGKLNDEHERLVAAKTQGLDAYNRRMYDREMRAAQRAEMERQYDNLTNQFLRRLEETQSKNAQSYAQMQTLEALYSQPQHPQVPLTPELPLSTINSPVSPNRQQNIFGSFNPTGAIPMKPSLAAAAAGRRERSSSMLSGISNFTDDIDDPSDVHLKFPASPPFGTIGHAYTPFPAFAPGANTQPMTAMMMNGGPQRRRSIGARSGSGSTSGSGSANGSQRDPLSPVQQHKAIAGFISGGAIKSPGSPLSRGR